MADIVRIRKERGVGLLEARSIALREWRVRQIAELRLILGTSALIDEPVRVVFTQLLDLVETFTEPS